MEQKWQLASESLRSSLRAQTLVANSLRSLIPPGVILRHEVLKLLKKITEAEKRSESTGLTSDELAFYDAMSDNESASELMGEDILKQIARDLTVSIKNSVSIDWAIRDSVQAKMRMTIKRLLKKYGYPPDKAAKAIDIVMEQTKLMCSNEVTYAPSSRDSSLAGMVAEETSKY